MDTFVCRVRLVTSSLLLLPETFSCFCCAATDDCVLVGRSPMAGHTLLIVAAAQLSCCLHVVYQWVGVLED